MAIPTPTNGFWDLSLWDDFGAGWDVLPALVAPGTGIKRAEMATPNVGRRQQMTQAEVSMPGVARRIDQ